MPAHSLLEAALGFAPVLLFLTALLYLDSFKLVSAAHVFGVMLFGVLAAAATYPISGLLMDAFHVDFHDYSRFMAPALEEGLKAAMIIWLFARNRIGFMIDAAILGAAVGAGFALAENIYYAYVFSQANLGTWIVRGLGTAVMHSGTTAVFAIATEALRERREGLGLVAAIPGFLFAISLHAIFNQFLDFPIASTAGVLVVLPLMLMMAIDKSEHEVHGWLIHDYESHEHLLADIQSGRFLHSEAGAFILSLAARFSKKTVADIFAYLKLHTELVICAEKLLLAREQGEPAHACRADAEQFARLHALERRIGRTALLAVWPHLKFSRQELYELHALEHEAQHARAAG
ncbi:MAG TPA: PrsW family glutamic-type intramembrane protease [Rhizomicrobium sp.]|nr:PrsW family glutamic-type intramembrane protease [Rhizomicrobium sp.]